MYTLANVSRFVVITAFTQIYSADLLKLEWLCLRRYYIYLDLILFKVKRIEESLIIY